MIYTGRGLAPPKIARHRLRHDIEQMTHILHKFSGEGERQDGGGGGGVGGGGGSLSGSTAQGDGAGADTIRMTHHRGVQTLDIDIVRKTRAVYRKILSQAPPQAGHPTASGKENRALVGRDAALRDAFEMPTEDWDRIQHW